MMSISNMVSTLKWAGLAWRDKGEIEHLVSQAKVMEGPTPSWKTGEFWVNVVLPVLAGIIGGAASVASAPALAPYFVIATTVLALGAYLGRTWLKGKHLVANQALDLSNPDTMAQITAIVQNVTAAVHAVKDAKAGNFESATKVQETLNAAGSVNVNVTPAS